MTPNHDNITAMIPGEVVTPGIYTATQLSGLVDLIDSQAAALLLHIGIGGIAFTANNSITVTVTHGSAADGSDQVPVGDLDVLKDGFAPAAIVAGVVRTITAAKAAADIQKLGYVGGQRFVKVSVAFNGAHATGTPVAVSALRGRPALKGVA